MSLSTSRPPVAPATFTRPVPFGARLIATSGSVAPVARTCVPLPVAAPCTMSWFPALGPKAPDPWAVRFPTFDTTSALVGVVPVTVSVEPEVSVPAATVLPVAAATVKVLAPTVTFPVTPRVPATVALPSSAWVWPSRPRLSVVAVVPPTLIGCATVASIEKPLAFEPRSEPATVVFVASTLNREAPFACRSRMFPVNDVPAAMRAIVPPVALVASRFSTPAPALPA